MKRWWGIAQAVVRLAVAEYDLSLVSAACDRLGWRHEDDPCRRCSFERPAVEKRDRALRDLDRAVQS